jgi:hypothetical protein
MGVQRTVDAIRFSDGNKHPAVAFVEHRVAYEALRDYTDCLCIAVGYLWPKGEITNPL